MANLPLPPCALQESDKEQAAAAAALRPAQAEAAELRGALAAAAAKSREAEGLVADFTGVVQQQKAAIQASWGGLHFSSGRGHLCVWVRGFRSMDPFWLHACMHGALAGAGVVRREAAVHPLRQTG